MGNRLKKILLTSLIVGTVSASLVNMKINYVEVNGNDKIKDMEVLSCLFENEHERNPIYFYIRNKFFEKKSMKYVSDYDIEWKSPFSIAINISEKPSIAFYKKELKNIYFDKDGIINEVSSERLNDVIEVSGVEFFNSEMGERVDLKDKKMLMAILNITSALKDSNLPVRFLEINKDDEITVFVGGITVVLGDVENMEIKLGRLNDIYKEVQNLSGVLYLSNARENMLDEHYIFKKN